MPKPPRQPDMPSTHGPVLNAIPESHARPPRRVWAALLARLKLWLAPRGVQQAVAFAIIGAVMLFIEFGGPAILDNDGYYHIRWARLLRESAPRLPPFMALPLTTLDEQRYADHHFLFHVLLIPFTYGDLRIGAKLAAVLFSTIGIGAVFGLLIWLEVPYRWLWFAPLVGSSEPFLYRMSMTRAPALSLAALGIGSYLILKRKLLALGFLSFAFVWLYSLFPLILVFSVGHAIAVYLSERRIDAGPSAASAAGIALGLVVNPYFPRNIALLREHMMMKATGSYAVDVGIEWYPYDTWVILGGSVIAFAVFFLAVAVFDYRSRLKDVRPLFFLIVSTVLLVMAFRSRRFIEYWPPFAIVFASFSLRSMIERLMYARRVRTRDQAIAAITVSLVIIGLVVGISMAILEARRDVKNETDTYAYRGASEWLETNTPRGSIIFNTDWDDFPMLFYYDPGNTYVAGLDPTYLYDRDRDLWRLYGDITLGRTADPAPLIRDRFGAEYVFTDNQHSDFLARVEASGNFETVYTDRYATVLRVRATN